MNKSTLNKLSPGLKKLIVPDDTKAKGTLSVNVKKSSAPISKFAERTLMHCNGGSTLQAALWLKEHLKNGGKLVVTLAGALSSFQVGVMLAELIRQNKVHLVSATGANHEESYYRYVAHSHYANIPRYTELTPHQEAELRDAGLRRITDTFLPEDESVRIMEPHLLKMWQDAQKKGERYFPQEYFHMLYDWYMKTSKSAPIAFLQLGGGIAADFPICVVPSLKHDLEIKKVRDWAGFIEIGSSPMSYGSYSGAGGKEKITWDKLSTESYYQIIQSDVNVVFPWIAAILLDL